jgi:hypothetical protein
MKVLNIREFLSAIFLGIIGIILSIGAYMTGLGFVANPGGGFVPFLIGVVLTLLSLTFLIQRIQGKTSSKKPPPFWPEKRSKVRVAYSLGAILVYVLVFEWMGFAVATFGLFLFLLKTIDPVKWRSAIFLSFLVTIIWFLLFQVFLKAQLPEGWVSWWRISRWIF